jgi:hypothetical protein
MITVKAAKIYYKLETAWQERYYDELVTFLTQKGLAGKLPLFVPTLKDMVGKTVELRSKEFNLNIRFNPESINLLFETEMDSDEFSKFIEGFFL